MTVFKVTSRLCLALALTAAIGQAGTALAQNARTIIVGSGTAAVEVALGVLNRLGPAPNLPRLLSPRPAMTAASAHPPGGSAPTLGSGIQDLCDQAPLPPRIHPQLLSVKASNAPAAFDKQLVHWRPQPR